MSFLDVDDAFNACFSENFKEVCQLRNCATSAVAVSLVDAEAVAMLDAVDELLPLVGTGIP